MLQLVLHLLPSGQKLYLVHILWRLLNYLMKKGKRNHQMRSWLCFIQNIQILVSEPQTAYQENSATTSYTCNIPVTDNFCGTYCSKLSFLLFFIHSGNTHYCCISTVLKTTTSEQVLWISSGNLQGNYTKIIGNCRYIAQNQELC